MTEPLEGFVPYPPELAQEYRRKGYWKGRTLGEHLDAWVDRYAERVAIVAGDRCRLGRLQRVDGDQHRVLDARERRQPARQQDRGRGAQQGADARRAGVGDRVRERLVRERDLEREGLAVRRDRVGPASAVEHALEERRLVDRPRDPASHALEAGARDDVVGAVPDAQRARMGREQRREGLRAHERGGRSRQVDDERRGAADLGDPAGEDLEGLVAQHAAPPSQRAKPRHEASAAVVGAQVRNDLGLEEGRERCRSPDRAVVAARDHDARRGPLCGAPESQRFRKESEMIRLPAVRQRDDDDVGPRVAQRLRALAERPRIPGAHPDDDLDTGGEQRPQRRSLHRPRMRRERRDAERTPVRDVDQRRRARHRVGTPSAALTNTSKIRVAAGET